MHDMRRNMQNICENVKIIEYFFILPLDKRIFGVYNSNAK